jgi:hypothetical protein
LINDEHHIALPKLYGAPAYARPPRAVAEVAPRPLDEDDLPLEVFRAADDGPLPQSSSAAHHGSNGNGSGNGSVAVAEDGGRLEGRPFSLRALSRFISGR